MVSVIPLQLAYSLWIIAMGASCIKGELDPLKHKLAYQSEFFSLAHQTSDHSRLVGLHRHFNVLLFGAIGDGIADDTEAFVRAWNVACNVTSSRVVVPSSKTFFLRQTVFKGPCAPGVTFQISGTIVAPPAPAFWSGKSTEYWILFSHLESFAVDGGGTLDGQGQEWWARSCKINSHNACHIAPTAVTFHKCSNLRIANITVQNGQQTQLYVEDSTGVLISDLQIIAPYSSPNTDGIHISGSQYVMITNSRITCGDDCISIQTGTSNVQILHSECGPSHGISIGGLGQRHSFAQVNDILVDHVNLIGTMNGLRIKTWQGGQGWASRVSYQNVRMLNVSNPIIIDQFYCDSSRPCNIQPSAVQINQVSYKNVTGSSSNPVAISFECSASVPCRNLLLESIQLLALWPGQRTVSRCHNARGISVGNVAPGSCLD